MSVFLIIACPVALVVLSMLWWRSRILGIDPWYGGSSVREASHFAPMARSRMPSGRDQTIVPSDQAEITEAEVCQKVLFCWDYWSSGKSALNLQDIFEARNLPAELREVVSRVDDEAEPVDPSFR